MFPDTDDSPTLTFEGFGRAGVPFNGFVDFCPPALVAVIFKIVTKLAAVPETAIHEYQSSFAWKDKIWLTSQCAPT